MSFSILSYMDSLTITKEFPSEYTVECPICGGKLKIRKSNGAYTCYTNYCSSFDIRNKIAPLEGDYVDTQRHRYEPPQVQPIDFPNQFYLNHIKKRYRYEEVLPKDGVLTYYYSKRQRIKRIEISSSTKQFLPETLCQGSWFIGTNNETFPFYNKLFFEQAWVQQHDKLANIVLVAEGEKKANITTALTGVLLLSPAGYCYSERHLLKVIHDCSKYVDGFIYLPDNDVPGNKKAVLFQKSCWKLGIPCRISDLSHFFESSGDDILDIVRRQNISSAAQLTKVIL
jgi:hypothetical protein